MLQVFDKGLDSAHMKELESAKPISMNKWMNWHQIRSSSESSALGQRATSWASHASILKPLAQIQSVPCQPDSEIKTWQVCCLGWLSLLSHSAFASVPLPLKIIQIIFFSFVIFFFFFFLFLRRPAFHALLAHFQPVWRMLWRAVLPPEPSAGALWC